MANKKRGKKTSKKVKRVGNRSAKKIKKSSKKSVGKRFVRSTKRKINLVLKNLVLFAVLALVSFGLYVFSNNVLFRSLFGLLAMILGFVGLAFLIVLLALLGLKLMKK